MVEITSDGSGKRFLPSLFQPVLFDHHLRMLLERIKYDQRTFANMFDFVVAFIGNGIPAIIIGLVALGSVRLT